MRNVVYSYPTKYVLLYYTIIFNIEMYSVFDSCNVSTVFRGYHIHNTSIWDDDDIAMILGNLYSRPRG